MCKQHISTMSTRSTDLHYYYSYIFLLPLNTAPCTERFTSNKDTQVFYDTKWWGVFLNTKDLNHTPASAVVALAKTVTLIFGEMLRGEQSFGATGFSGSQARVVELFVGWEAPGVNRSWHENTDLVRSSVGGREVVHAVFIGTDKGHERGERCRAFRWKTGWKRAVKVSDDILMCLLKGQRGA